MSLLTSVTTLGIVIWADDCTSAVSNLPFYRFNCSEGQTSPTASLIMKGPSHAVFNLFHSIYHFSNTALVGLLALAMVVTNVTYGICIPSGLFVPAIW